MASHNDLGKQGEDIACEYLRKKGFLLLDRNWIWLKAELDIVALHKNQLVVTEVKTRSIQYHTETDDLIGKKKLNLIYAATDRYIEVKKITFEVRYDLVVIIFHGDSWTVEHYEDAFYPFMNT